MPEEKNLSLVNTVEDIDKIRVVTSTGLSHSIEVGHLKNSLFINELSGRVSILENKDITNDTTHVNMNSKIEELELVVGEGGEEGFGLVKEISDIRLDLAKIDPEEISRLGGELEGIHADLTSINGTNGQLAILTDRQDNLESAIDAGFKVIDEAPASTSATGQPGEVFWDTQYFYVCVAVNTWKRIPLSSW